MLDIGAGFLGVHRAQVVAGDHALAQLLDAAGALQALAELGLAEQEDLEQRVAAGLAAQGIGPGDRVGLLLWNDLRHFECYFAVPLTGATMVQLNLRLAPQDLAYVIRHSGARTLIVDATLLPLAEGLAPHLPEDTRWIVASDGDLPEAWAGRADAVSYEDLVAGHEPIEDAPDMDERSASGACYTTGTTGRPKGVYYSHRSTWLHSFAVAASTGSARMSDTRVL